MLQGADNELRIFGIPVTVALVQSMGVGLLGAAGSFLSTVVSSV